MNLPEDSPLLLDDEAYLEHYGVKGMKWGVRKAERKSRQNRRLEKKVERNEKRSAKFKGLADRAHKNFFLDNHNDIQKMRSLARNERSTSKRYADRADRSTNEIDYTRNRQKSAQYKQASSHRATVANALERDNPYGIVSRNLYRYSDYYKFAADRARRKIADNEVYIALMRQKASDFSKEDRVRGEEFVRRMNKLKTSYKKRK